MARFIFLKLSSNSTKKDITPAVDIIGTAMTHIPWKVCRDNIPLHEFWEIKYLSFKRVVPSLESCKSFHENLNTTEEAIDLDLAARNRIFNILEQCEYDTEQLWQEKIQTKELFRKSDFVIIG